MKKLFILLTFLIPLLAWSLTIKETRNNTNIEFYTKDSGVSSQVGIIDYTGEWQIGTSVISTLNGVITLNTKTQLQSTDFPDSVNHNGNLFGWRADDSEYFLNVFGSLELDFGFAPTKVFNHLDENVNCYYNGSNTWQSTNGDSFGITGDLSFSIWVYRDDWSTNFSTIRAIASRSGVENGWKLYGLNAATDIAFQVESGGVAYDDVLINADVLSSGWHHFAVARDNGSFTSMYIDGLLLGKTTSTNTITADGDIEIGSFNQGAGKWEAGRLDEFWVQGNTVWTNEQVKTIYARGSRRYATQLADGNIDITLPLEGKWFDWIPTYTNYGTVTTHEGKYNVIGDMVTIALRSSGTPTGTTDILATMPLVMESANLKTAGYGYDSAPKPCIIYANDTSTLVWKKYDNAIWTVAGGKEIGASLSYVLR